MMGLKLTFNNLTKKLSNIFINSIVYELFVLIFKINKFNSIIFIQLKMYEVLISQAQGSLLHHKQVVKPLMRLLSIETDFKFVFCL